MHNKATNLAGYQEAQKRMESYQKWHDIVKKDMQPLFDRNRKIVLEKMKKESEQQNKRIKQPQEHLI